MVVHLDPPDSVLDKRLVDREVHHVEYESPSAPDCKIDTEFQSVSESTNQIFELLKQKSFLL